MSADREIHTVGHSTRTIEELIELLREHAVLVVAYGGWRDAFMEALVQVLDEPGAGIDVLWCFYGDEANTRHRYRELLDRFERYIRFTPYCGVDGHKLFDELVRPVSEPSDSSKRQPSPTQTSTAGPDDAEELPITHLEIDAAQRTDFPLARCELFG